MQNHYRCPRMETAYGLTEYGQRINKEHMRLQNHVTSKISLSLHMKSAHNVV